MQTALLQNGQLITAKEYDVNLHGSILTCIDKNCGAPLIFVSKSKSLVAHFKSTGKGDSIHSKSCGFYEKLDVIGAVAKTKEYQSQLLPGRGINENVIRLNMNRIDPDFESKSVQRESKDSINENLKIKQDNETPLSISSVKSVVKLLTEYEPDILATIVINVGNGRKIPLSELVLNHYDAHFLLWEEKSYLNTGYFVYGKVEKFVKRETVLYIRFSEDRGISFTLVLFQKYWKEFSYTEQDLVGKYILAYGLLRKNDYKEGNHETEMVIKSEKYIERIKAKNLNDLSISSPRDTCLLTNI